MDFSAEDVTLFRAQARILIGLVAIAWVIHVMNMGTGYGLSKAFGLRPRNPWGLVGIPFSPLLHWSNDHIAGNTQAFLILGWFILMQGIHLFYFVTISIALLGGLLGWLFGNYRVGAGASGVTYGYRGFLLIYGIASGNLAALVIAAISTYFYRDRIFGTAYSRPGILPGGSGWSAHLFGFIAGMLTAYLLSILKLSHY